MLKTIAAGLLGAALSAGAANAAVLWDFQETGGDVVGIFAGSLDLSGAGSAGAGGLPFDLFSASDAAAIQSDSTGSFDTYEFDAAPANFGTDGLTLATSGTGDAFAVLGANSGNEVGVPTGYASGQALAGTLTFANQTFAALGVTPGSYVFSLPNDTITVRFGPTAPVPLPATLPLLLAGFGGLALLRRRRAG
ncbi:VPLPA-CTERM sorting domain-containing protein [Jannaschia sp. W003]|uniref:VPLPA-CTERM sorting domain-containing protein n=1 Tax=Jannaschia sp. W003 TaxID=2867012 RepID=UPI0021A284A0|nr:VPLPA-CTERM sorting domain-containing protein [Jannaschia sp. W003]UWQ22746.1 VPLPA-CTERM sorting domain-containing protein [Jannaschia sp. W003]